MKTNETTARVNNWCEKDVNGSIVRKHADFNFGKVDGYHNGRNSCKVTATMDLQLKNSGWVLSIYGRISNSRGTDAIMCGQCEKEINRLLARRSHRNGVKMPEEWAHIYELWKAYHLNDMHAGTPAQEAYLATIGAKSYTEQVAALKEANLLFDNGYQYGTSWLFREIPASALEEVNALMGF